MTADAPDSSIRHDRDRSDRGVFILRARCVLPLPRPQVFAFFSDARNLEALTPRSLRFRILTAGEISMGAGTMIDYSITLHGIPMIWKTLISHWEPDTAFVDTQLRGPYALWVHRHSFSDAPGGGCVIEDEVRYRLPFGPLGRLVQPVIRRQLDAIFRYRQERVGSLLVPPATRTCRPGSESASAAC